MKSRLFIGFDLSKPLKKRISSLIKSLKNKWPDLKYVQENNIHLTLIFLGQISDQDLWQTIKIIQEIAGNFNPFFIESREVNPFPTCKNPKIVSLNIKENKILSDLKEKITRQLVYQNITKQENRLFKPHISLARIRKSNTKLDLKNYHSNFKEKINKIDIFASQLTKEGPIYNIIQSIKL